MTQDILYWLAFTRLRGISHRQKLQLLRCASPESLLHMDAQALKSLGLTSLQVSSLISASLADAEQYYHQCQALDIHCIPISHRHYPPLLREIADPPLLLFVRGDCSLLSSMQLAIVGPRMASYAALDVANDFAANLSDKGLTITSGLAVGIDSAAHRGTLQVKGKTIAVVATGLDQTYPRRNDQLSNEILSNGGVIVSEYFLQTPPRAANFPKRNRIITGLSLGTLVVEAALKSGSLISARLAMEQNREVFAIPGSINNVNSKGCHQLIKQGAHLVDSVDDITANLPTLTTNLQVPEKSKKIKKNEPQSLFLDPLLASVDYEVTSADVVASRCKLPVEEVLTRLTILELRGLVTAVPGGYLKQK
ncbi:DNA-processing protein DprA [Thalassotalea mangrovi]|uniref:DNA-protecting protein DprA n=1 Tax=Thalassotalea mangrovi TaxID=2572245 RepID=A0A4U1B780_9GAMM|nr:DNA-processing protein DprA [Thalassotalea mangrovi]TKB46428.1 DNA-protecting protein DprA [Thalassotalea mangrovi]